jgi:two-component system sensor histidine kinase/response regulator
MEAQMDKENPHILIVDDEPSARDTLEALLFRQGYDLAFAASGPEALACLNEIEPDVILLDVMMPGMDGFRVCQRLKTDKRWRHIPIILVTALDSKEDLTLGLDAGADDFLSKPVNGLELRARVRSMLRIKKQHDELEAILHLREDLANMIVHDMRSPLAAILGFSELLKRKTTALDDLEDIEVIWTQARRLESFLNDMLLLAKMEKGKLILDRSTVDIGQLVLEVEKSHDFIARSKRFNLVTDLPEESRPILLDANLFQRVLDNLISNALEFSPAESTVTLRVEYPRAETASPHVRIQVLDEGPGIPEEHRDRIFDKFETVALKKGDVPQVGLGLAFCKMVVEAHGGHIFVDANEPKGSVFTVEI